MRPSWFFWSKYIVISGRENRKSVKVARLQWWDQILNLKMVGFPESVCELAVSLLQLFSKNSGHLFKITYNGSATLVSSLSIRTAAPVMSWMSLLWDFACACVIWTVKVAKSWKQLTCDIVSHNSLLLNSHPTYVTTAPLTTQRVRVRGGGGVVVPQQYNQQEAVGCSDMLLWWSSSQSGRHDL